MNLKLVVDKQENANTFSTNSVNNNNCKYLTVHGYQNNTNNNNFPTTYTNIIFKFKTGLRKIKWTMIGTVNESSLPCWKAEIFCENELCDVEESEYNSGSIQPSGWTYHKLIQRPPKSFVLQADKNITTLIFSFYNEVATCNIMPITNISLFFI